MIGIPRGGGLLRRLVRVSTTHPLVTIGVSLGLAALGIAYTASALTFKSTVRDLLPSGQRYVTLYNEYTADFGELEDIVVVVQGRTPDESKAYAARLNQELRKAPTPFERITYRIDPARFEGRALLYLSVDKLKEVRDRILDHQELMESFAAAPSLDRLIDGINRGSGRPSSATSSTWGSKTAAHPRTSGSSASCSPKSPSGWTTRTPTAPPGARCSPSAGPTRIRAISSPKTRVCSSC